ncbi:hypothetical protein [Streptomyces sp. NPDC091217]|uniref:hypothetical protein n=1 Tax=Streptomyces sp. NPDC091217 TaxID=3365975 RepID=UPI00381A288C
MMDTRFDREKDMAGRLGAAMPVQAQPVDRTAATAPSAGGNTPGVEASSWFTDLAKTAGPALLSLL